MPSRWTDSRVRGISADAYQDDPLYLPPFQRSLARPGLPEAYSGQPDATGQDQVAKRHDGLGALLAATISEGGAGSDVINALLASMSPERRDRDGIKALLAAIHVLGRDTPVSINALLASTDQDRIKSVSAVSDFSMES